MGRRDRFAGVSARDREAGAQQLPAHDLRPAATRVSAQVLQRPSGERAKIFRVERISLSQRARLSARAGLHREPARGNSSAQIGMIKTRVRLA